MASRAHDLAAPQPSRRRGVRGRVPRVHLGSAAWLLVAVGLTLMVGAFQVGDRAPLVWDEAARVNAGVGLATALDQGSLGGVWDWVNAQTFYPFLSSALHGVVFFFTGDELVAGWLPTLVAYGLCGLLVGRLALELGAPQVGAWVAALLFWLAPIEARLSGGAFTEIVGACVEVAVLILLTRLYSHPRLKLALGTGALAGAAWWLKYDYGLIVMGTVALTGLIVVVTRRDRKTLVAFAAAGLAAVLVVAGFMTSNFEGKLEGASEFIGPAAPGATSAGDIGRSFTANASPDFLFYPRLLLGDGEVGIAPPVGVLMLLSVAWVLSRWRARPCVRPAVVFTVLWLVVYSLAMVKFPRFSGTLIPVLAVFTGVLVGDGWRWAQRRSWPRPAVAGVAAVALVAVCAAHVPSMRQQFFFLAPHPEARAGLEYIVTALRPTDRPVVVIGANNEVSLSAVQLAWNRRLGRPGPLIEPVEEALPQQRPAMLVDRLRGLRPDQIVGVEVARGSRFDSADLQARFASHPDYLMLLRELEDVGVVRQVSRRATPGRTLTVTVWRMGRPPRPIGEPRSLQPR